MKNNQKGYTIVEIVTVLAIIGTLSAIFLTSYRSGEKQIVLKRAAYKLSQDLRKTQAMAMSAKNFNGSFPKGGYGVYFSENANSYIIFADCDNDTDYDSVGSAVSCQAATNLNPFPEKIEEVSMEKRTLVSSVIPSLGGALKITFFPPDPVVAINPTATNLRVNISLDDATSTVTVASSGLIDIEYGQ